MAIQESAEDMAEAGDAMAEAALDLLGQLPGYMSEVGARAERADLLDAVQAWREIGALVAGVPS